MRICVYGISLCGSSALEKKKKRRRKKSALLYAVVRSSSLPLQARFLSERALCSQVGCLKVLIFFYFSFFSFSL